MGIKGVPFDKKDIINAIHKKGGILAHAANSLGCDRKTIYDWSKRDKDVEKAIQEARDQANKDRIDDDQEIKQLAYASIKALLQEGDVTATIFALKAKGEWTQGETGQSITVNTNSRPYKKEK